MILDEKTKEKIRQEHSAWVERQYAGKTADERKKFAQFFTPPEIAIRMLEKFDTVVDKNILDPACGCGNLLSSVVLAGADPQRVYGIEIDESIAAVARERLARLGVPPEHIKTGDALDAESYNF